MKITKIALGLSLVYLVGNVQAAVMMSGSTTGAVSTTTAPVPITVTSDGATALVQAELSYVNTQILLTQGNVVNSPGFTCTVNQATGKIIIIGGNDAGPLTGTPNPVCTVAYPITATATFPIALTVQNKLCSTFNGNPTLQPCTSVSGSITAGGGVGTPPTLGALAPATLSGGVSPTGTGTVAVPVATAGTAVASVATACSIPAGANAFTITSGAALTFTAPAAVPGTAAVGLSCNRTAAAATAVLTCTQTANPAGAVLPNLTSTVTCPAIGVVAVAPTATIAATTTLTGGAGTIAVDVVTAGTVGGSLALACTVPPGANAYAITVGANRTITGPATVGANAPAIGVSCTPGAVVTTAIVSCAQTATPAGAALAPLTSTATCPAGIPTAVTATTPASGSTTILTAQPIGGGTSTQVLSFGSTGAGTMNCAVTPASPGYSVTPVVTLTAAGPNNATVTFTGTTSGTFLGTVVCTPVAPATGGPFTYNFSTTVAGALVPQIQVPALGNISLMLLIAGFLGLGAVLVGRR